jgi:hypothetical protein
MIIMRIQSFLTKGKYILNIMINFLFPGFCSMVQLATVTQGEVSS